MTPRTIDQHASRPYLLSCATLAHELDVAESTVYELVNRGVLPKPIKLSSGCVRWCWDDVKMASPRSRRAQPPPNPIRTFKEPGVRRKKNSAIELPRGVHPVPSRGRIYYYYQRGRGTKHAGERIKLPSDPHSPEFWTALRQAQGIVGTVETDTLDALIDAFITAWPKLQEPLAEGTQVLYRRCLKVARKAWGKLQAKGLRPKHVREIMEGMSETPGAANNFLSAMRSLSGWARTHDKIEWPLTEGLKPYKLTGGHKPWSKEQINAAHEHLTGMIRRGAMLQLYTGQRGSDVVRLGPTMIDDGGFDLGWKGR